ncbi:MAG TPA: DUF362 domain-containing protein [Vicinamibacterales bacterium]
MSESLRPVVAVQREGARYGRAPFDPDRAYPELHGLAARIDPENTAYGLVRDAFICYDRDHFGTAGWNPFGRLVAPGDVVVIKPNLVIHDREGVADVRTHGAVVRCLLDYTRIALQGSGRIVVCDAPIQGADFGRLVEQSGLDRIVEGCFSQSGLDVSLIDLRSEWARVDDRSAFIQERVPLPGDPAGATLFDLADDSALDPISGPRTRLAVGDYRALFTSENHGPGRHRYRFSNTVLDADVVLNVAKMKTHQKAGVSGALKNVVGMNTSKDYLPHFRMGAEPDGDEFPRSAYNRLAAVARARLQERVPLQVWRALRRTAELAQRGLRRRRGGDARYGLLSGSWEGNDTIWRMVVDINRIARFGARDQRLHAEPRRRLYHIVDGIVAGEGEGPLKPRPRALGVLLHGTDAPAIDGTMAALMGFDPERIPQIREAFAPSYGLSTSGSLEATPVTVNPELAERLRGAAHFAFEPPRGWPSLRHSVRPEFLVQLAAACDILPPPIRHAGTAHDRR